MFTQQVTLSNEEPFIIQTISEAIRIFGDDDRALRWLSKPNSALEEKIPLELLSTENGRQLVNTRLGQIDHGIYI